MEKRHRFFDRLSRILSCIAIAGLLIVFIPQDKAAAHDGDIRIEIKNGFQPASVEILPGTTIEWRNKEDHFHTVTSGTGAFDSGLIRKGDEYIYTFTTPGTYTYTDRFSSYTGTIKVLGSSPATPTQPPPSSAAQPPSSPTTQPSAAPSASLSIGDNFFSPASVTVPAGGTVTWTNSDGKPHTVTSNSGVFNSGALNQGQSFSYTFQNPGTYIYYCAFHDGQTGTVQVTGTGQSQPATTTPATATPPNQNQPTNAPAVPGSLTIGDNFFSPPSLTVAAGVAVTWVNSGQKPHSVTSDGLFDSGVLNHGQSFSYIFQNPGAYAYHCALHDGQTGTIQVTATSQSQSTTDSAAITTPPAPPASSQTPAATPSSGSVSAVATQQSAFASSIGDSFFSPNSVTVPAGATVTWTNNGKLPHTVTSDTKLFDSGMLKTGQTFSFTFKNPGTYSYSCFYHTGQNGTVIVTEAAGAQAPASVASSHSAHLPPAPVVVEIAGSSGAPAEAIPTVSPTTSAPGTPDKPNPLSGVIRYVLAGMLALVSGMVVALIRAAKPKSL